MTWAIDCNNSFPLRDDAEAGNAMEAVSLGTRDELKPTNRATSIQSRTRLSGALLSGLELGKVLGGAFS